MTRLMFVFVLVVGIGPRAAAQGADPMTIALADPSRPATLNIALWAGVVNVIAVDTGAVVIDATAARRSSPGQRRAGGRSARAGSVGGRADASGLTRLQPPAGVEIYESNNVVTIRGPLAERVDLNIQVPVRTNLKLTKSAQGPTNSPGVVTVRGLDGDIEIHTNAGTITLGDVSGSVVAHSTNGSIVATVRRVTPDRPMAFTSYNGSIDVTLPRSVKANVFLQSGRGDVFTDFDIQKQPAGSGGTGSAGGVVGRSSDRAIRATVNGGGPDIELRTYAANVYLRRSN
jgi:hypothetical protein